MSNSKGLIHSMEYHKTTNRFICGEMYGAIIKQNKHAVFRVGDVTQQ
jgi:hypothetical protein